MTLDFAIMLLGTVGPFLTIIGAVLLARDVMSGPRYWYSLDFYRGNLDAIDRMRKSVAQDYHNLAESSEIDVSKWLQDAESGYAAMLRESLKKSAEDNLEERGASFKWGFYGLIAIALGNFMQAGAALLIGHCR